MSCFHPIFQSTLPVRGATAGRCRCIRKQSISIHAPRAGSDVQMPIWQAEKSISIHAPRAGSDYLQVLLPHQPQHFNPRSPCGERRELPRVPQAECFISIHAPRAGSDRARLRLCLVLRYFNPRSPCGERPGYGKTHTLKEYAFQSTLPVRGATRRPGCHPHLP